MLTIAWGQPHQYRVRYTLDGSVKYSTAHAGRHAQNTVQNCSPQQTDKATNATMTERGIAEAAPMITMEL
jgi:hypothetical protein